MAGNKNTLKLQIKNMENSIQKIKAATAENKNKILLIKVRIKEFTQEIQDSNNDIVGLRRGIQIAREKMKLLK